MANRYNQHSIQHHHFQQKNIFLPIFCRLSLKDINLNSHTTNRIPTDEPSSPKVSCMGQVKRNNRVIGFPTTTPAAASHHPKYTNLKRLFSSKTLLPPAANIPSSAVPASGRSGCRTGKDLRTNDSRRMRLKNDGDRDSAVKVVVNISEMDPPLPVVKKVGRDEVNIWKRRFNGTGLQIEQVHLPNCKFQHPPTV